MINQFYIINKLQISSSGECNHHLLNHTPNSFYFNLEVPFLLGSKVMTKSHFKYRQICYVQTTHVKYWIRIWPSLKWLPWQSDELDFPTPSVTWPWGQRVQLVDISELEKWFHGQFKQGSSPVSLYCPAGHFAKTQILLYTKTYSYINSRFHTYNTCRCAKPGLKKISKINIYAVLKNTLGIHVFKSFLMVN